MPNYVLIIAVIAWFFVLLIPVVFLGTAKRWQKRSRHRLLFWAYLPIGIALGCWGLKHVASGQLLSGLELMLFGGLWILGDAWATFGRRDKREELAAYEHDPRHCGRCDYDLSGNTSGTCTECGWTLPPGQAGEQERKNGVAESAARHPRPQL